MRVAICLALAAMFQACTENRAGPPQDCAQAKSEFWTCFDRYQMNVDGGISLDFESMWYACVPHTEPKIIEGSWASDFEWNAFFEGKEPSPEEAFPDEFPPNLAFKSGVQSPAVSGEAARLWKIRFVGREETCRLFDNVPPTFFVEEVLESELVWEVQGYPTYSFEPVGR